MPSYSTAWHRLTNQFHFCRICSAQHRQRVPNMLGQNECGGQGVGPGHGARVSGCGAAAKRTPPEVDSGFVGPPSRSLSLVNAYSGSTTTARCTLRHGDEDDSVGEGSDLAFARSCSCRSTSAHGTGTGGGPWPAPFTTATCSDGRSCEGDAKLLLPNQPNHVQNNKAPESAHGLALGDAD
jgi:hypothetical protein